MDNALMQDTRVMRPFAAMAAWETSPGIMLQQLYVLAEQARTAAEREVLRAHQLDMRAWLVLRALDGNKCATQRQITAATDLDKVAVNRAASWLKQRHLVVSLPNAEDGRSHFLELSPAGEDMLASCGRAIARFERDMLAGLTEGETWQLLNSLKHLRRSLSYRL